MDRCGRYTRRGFLGLSILFGLFYVHSQGLGILYHLKEEVKSPLKRLLFWRSHPVMETSVKKRWTDDSLIITVEESVEPFFRLNKTSGLILDWCDGNHTPSDIAKRLVNMRELDEKKARKEVFDALEAFYNSGLIKV